jgi:gluconokinase
MILAADLGSTNLKTAVFSSDGTRLGEGSRPLPYQIHTNTVSELSAEAVAQSFDEAVLAALRAAGVEPGEIKCAALTSQAQTFCVTDVDGRTVGPMIGWADERAVTEVGQLEVDVGSLFHQTTGWPRILPGLLFAKVLWWKNQHGLPPDHRIVTLPSFLALRMGAPLVLDQNLAAMTGLFNIPEGRWWTKALSSAGISQNQLPTLVELGAHISIDHSPADSLLPGLESIVFAGNDHTAGAFGCGCSTKRSVLTLGTAGVFYRFAGENPGPYSSEGLWGPYPNDRFYEARFIPHACSALDWADEFLFGSVESPRFVEIAKKAPRGCGGLVFYPERWGSPNAWSAEGTREQMARSVLEGIASSLYELAAPYLKAEGCGDGHEIVMLGGGSRLPLWVSIIEDIFGCPICSARTDGLDGAARMAGVGSF